MGIALAPRRAIHITSGYVWGIFPGTQRPYVAYSETVVAALGLELQPLSRSSLALAFLRLWLELFLVATPRALSIHRRSHIDGRRRSEASGRRVCSGSRQTVLFEFVVKRAPTHTQDTRRNRAVSA